MSGMRFRSEMKSIDQYKKDCITFIDTMILVNNVRSRLLKQDIISILIECFTDSIKYFNKQDFNNMNSISCYLDFIYNERVLNYYDNLIDSILKHETNNLNELRIELFIIKYNMFHPESNVKTFDELLKSVRKTKN
jgi:hypothetical protein